MKAKLRSWTDLIRGLGDSFLELLDAEIGSLGGDLSHSARRLVRGLVLLGIAGMFLFWLLGLLSLAAVEGVAVWLPRWGAVLVVAAVFASLALAIGLWGRGVLQSLEPPSRTVKRHWQDHRDWWERQVISDGDGPATGSEEER